MGAGHMCYRPLRTSAYVGRGERYLVGRVSDCCPAPLVLSGLACIEATQRRVGGGRSNLAALAGDVSSSGLRRDPDAWEMLAPHMGE